MDSKFVRPFREFGFFDGLLYAADRVLNGISERCRLRFYEMVAQPVPSAPLVAPALISSFQLREIHPGDPEVALMPARPEIKICRFKQGAFCLGLFDEDRLAGYIWFCHGQYEEDEARCTYVLNPRQSSVFDFDVYIFPKYRMGIAFVALWSKANEFLRSRGIERSFSRMTRFNLGSRRAHRHLLPSRVAYLYFLQIWQMELMIATIAPFIRISFTPSRRVLLNLRSRFRSDVRE